MTTEKQINIIGGGIAGLTTALTLQTKGINYQLFEKKSSITYENVGLGISANIFHILKELNIWEETKKLGAKIQNFHFVDQHINYIKTFKINESPLSVNRKKFYELILDRLQMENIHLNSEKNIEDFSKNEIVISADGIDSMTRHKIHPTLNKRDSKQILWRGITEIELDEKFKNSYHDFVGNNLRFAIIHTGENYYSWYIIKQKTENEPKNYSKEMLSEIFNNYHPIVKKVINKSSDIYFSELKDISPSSRKNLKWYKENVLLIGDAIHPTTPNMANGACLAMEDAYLLGNLLHKENFDTKNIFEDFQRQRTQKVNAVVIQSWLFGQLIHQKNIIIDKIIQFGFSITPKFMFDKIYSTVLTKIELKK